MSFFIMGILLLTATFSWMFFAYSKYIGGGLSPQFVDIAVIETKYSRQGAETPEIDNSEKSQANKDNKNSDTKVIPIPDKVKGMVFGNNTGPSQGQKGFDNIPYLAATKANIRVKNFNLALDMFQQSPNRVSIGATQRITTNNFPIKLEKFEAVQFQLAGADVNQFLNLISSFQDTRPKFRVHVLNDAEKPSILYGSVEGRGGYNFRVQLDEIRRINAFEQSVFGEVDDVNVIIDAVTAGILKNQAEKKDTEFRNLSHEDFWEILTVLEIILDRNSGTFSTIGEDFKSDITNKLLELSSKHDKWTDLQWISLFILLEYDRFNNAKVILKRLEKINPENIVTIQKTTESVIAKIDQLKSQQSLPIKSQSVTSLPSRASEQDNPVRVMIVAESPFDFSRELKISDFENANREMQGSYIYNVAHGVFAGSNNVNLKFSSSYLSKQTSIKNQFTSEDMLVWMDDAISLEQEFDILLYPWRFNDNETLKQLEKISKNKIVVVPAGNDSNLSIFNDIGKSAFIASAISHDGEKPSIYSSYSEDSYWISGTSPVLNTEGRPVQSGTAYSAVNLAVLFAKANLTSPTEARELLDNVAYSIDEYEHVQKVVPISKFIEAAFSDER